ncbi:MAG: TIGR03862 family flavoprotein [Bacteroidetes bacterium]|nr:TIGR03862 family flavoprotein [Bacteroidota bacterium]
MVRKKVLILGGGPAAMMLAANLDREIFEVHLYERNPALGRKFLVAGQGGFNLTHAESMDAFAGRYTPPGFMNEALSFFTNADLQNWFRELGIETYVGTSQRVFPVKGIKPIEVLNAILKHLQKQGVQIHTHHDWQGIDGDALVFQSPQGLKKINSDLVVLALGGASWKVTGSDGGWVPYLQSRRITCLPFRPSNCAYHIEWPEAFAESMQGQALKNMVFSCGGVTRAGEAVITRAGIEGSGIYPLSPQIREQLQGEGSAKLYIDLKPQHDLLKIQQALETRGRKSLTEILEKEIKLSRPATALLKALLSRDDFMSPALLANRIKHFELTVVSAGPVDDAISTVGGIALSEITPDFELKKLPGYYAIGEMLDWDAPTGGYLLQAAFSMGARLAAHLNRRDGI